MSGSMSGEYSDESYRREYVTELHANEDVYSYYMFTMPVEEKKSINPITFNKCLATLLVFAVLFLQGTMLYAIFKVVVIGTDDWQNGIVELKGEKGVCNPGGSLCRDTGGEARFSCAPPSVQLTGRWEELDTNGDGLWTKEEVKAAQDELQCKYAVNPVEVFDVFIKFLLERKDTLWLHPNITLYKAISKPYFTYVMGDLIMCGYRNEDMCPNLLQRGIFDAPLTEGTAPRVGTTIDSALAYCYGLLEGGGLCERTLPSTYRVWRKHSADQCMGPSYEPFIYRHPKNGRSKSMLAVDYAAHSAYSRAESSDLFSTYKMVIIVFYLLAMFVELKHLTYVATWIMWFPSAREFGDEAVVCYPDQNGQSKRWKIQGVSPMHRFMVTLISIIRFFFVVVALVVGITFLLAQTSYLDLLLNGLGLIFIVEILKLLYEQMLNKELRVQCENTMPMMVEAKGHCCVCWAKHPALRELIWFILLLVVLFGWVGWHHEYVLAPMTDALECTCLSQGKHCLEAERFSNSFWDAYWNEKVPAAFQEVDVYKAEWEKAKAKQQEEPEEETNAAPSPAKLHGFYTNELHAVPKEDMRKWHWANPGSHVIGVVAHHKKKRRMLNNALQTHRQ